MELDEKSMGELLDEFLQIEKYAKNATKISVKEAKLIELEKIDPQMMYEFIKFFRVEKKKRHISLSTSDIFICCKGFREICNRMKNISKNGNVEFNIIFQRYLKKSGVMPVEETLKYLGISKRQYDRYREKAILNIIEVAELYKEEYLLNNSQGSNPKQ